MSTPELMDLRHLGREVKTALELAIVALCPTELVDRLAMAAGLLDAIAELPLDSPALAALVPRVDSRARTTLSDWGRWRDAHLRKLTA